MKHFFPFWIIAIGCCLFTKPAFAQANSEEIAVGRVLISLQLQSQDKYISLFLPLDTLTKWMQEITPANENDARKLDNIRSNPNKLKEFDPTLDPDIIAGFNNTLIKGKDSGIHWSDLIMARYELEKMLLPRELIGLSQLMPIRLQGYIFVEDQLTRRRYIISVKDIYTIKGKWYGGRVTNVLEADNIDEFLDKYAVEKKMDKEKLLGLMYGNSDNIEMPAPDSNKAITQKMADSDNEEEEEKKVTKDIVERKLYKGMFDNETAVELYIRGMKGDCKETTCSWQAMYRFQDMDEYIKLVVTKAPDGTWIFMEDPEVGVMELKLQGDKLKGTWTSLKDKTEYEVDLTEKKEVKSKKLFELDDIIENDLYAK